MRSRIVHYCHRMDLKGWVANHDGNITVRSKQRLIATPTARAKADLMEADLIETDLNGKKVVGRGKPFSEMAIHTQIYAARPEVQAIVHAHPIAATAVGCSNQEMKTTAIPEAVVSLGPGVPLVGLNLPGSEALQEELKTIFPYYHAWMIAGNGVFSTGENLEQAFLRMELVEHLAAVFLAAIPLGGPQMLPVQQLAELLVKREKAGLSLPPDPVRPQWFPR